MQSVSAHDRDILRIPWFVPKKKRKPKGRLRLSFSGDMVWRRELPRFGSAPGFARPPVPERSCPA
jgi:hypothetical protein